ncbi:SulP family inorganic anion transporter [Ilumatobacter nonamiensis]|uniref:SulP family inorganic anion transporter n=1 Tax=Ilumatobacter nonamiensis TaxID=467093 RepID=UPI0003449CF6|nr:SulP family inorganic anion transporter [Ilumatobacter nonamiensis]
MTDATRSTSLVSLPERTLTSVIPILGWLRRYRWKRDLPVDLIAGLALAALLIPESMGYAGVAGVPAEVGLYAALGAVAAYAITGGSSILVVGPASAVAALSASIVADFSGDVDPIALTSALAITSGVLLIVAGILRLGWIVNFISRPVLEAFIAGLSISIIIGQLDGLLGVEVDGESAVAQFIDIVSNVADWQGWTVLIGVAAVIALLLLERYAARVPAAIVVVVAGIVIVEILDLASRGVEVVGDIPQGLPDVGVPELSMAEWLELLAGGLSLMLVGFSEGFAAVSSVSSATGEEVDSDQELIGSGAANVASGLVGGLAVSGSLSKSEASIANGARSQMANVVGGITVLATLLFLGPLFEILPEPVLAAVVIVAVLGAANPTRVLDLWDVNRADFIAGVITFVLVLVWEALPAMIVGVVISLAFVVRRASFPDVLELYRTSDGSFVARGDEELDAAPVDGVAILRFEAPLIYANAGRLVRGSKALIAARPDATRFILDAEMVSDLDASGARALAAIDDALRERGIEMRIARFHRRARQQVHRSKLRARFEGRIFPSLDAAVHGDA